MISPRSGVPFKLNSTAPTFFPSALKYSGSQSMAWHTFSRMVVFPALALPIIKIRNRSVFRSTVLVGVRALHRYETQCHLQNDPCRLGELACLNAAAGSWCRRDLQDWKKKWKLKDERAFKVLPPGSLRGWSSLIGLVCKRTVARGLVAATLPHVNLPVGSLSRIPRTHRHRAPFIHIHVLAVPTHIAGVLRLPATHVFVDTYTPLSAPHPLLLQPTGPPHPSLLIGHRICV
jgi:hypothetical protein